MAVPDDLGIGSGHLLQGREGLFRLRFLYDSDHGVQHDDEHDGYGVDPLSQRQRDERRDDQNDHQVVVELVPEQREEAWPRALRQFIGAEFPEAVLRFLLGQALFEVCLKAADEFLDRLAVGFFIVHRSLLQISWVSAVACEQVWISASGRKI